MKLSCGSLAVSVFGIVVAWPTVPADTADAIPHLLILVLALTQIKCAAARG